MITSTFSRNKPLQEGGERMTAADVHALVFPLVHGEPPQVAAPGTAHQAASAATLQVEICLHIQ